jgi:hypothetical protein
MILDATTIEALREAVDDEYKARATYRKVIEAFGPVRPFVNIVEAEDRHAKALPALFDRFGVEPPPDSWPGRAAGLASVASRHRHVWYIGVNLFLLVVIHASGVVMTLTERLQGVVSAWLVAAATTAAAATMAAYLLWANPPLRRELREREYREP